MPLHDYIEGFDLHITDYLPGHSLLDVPQGPIENHDQYRKRIEACYNLKVVRPFPLRLMLEVTNRCNMTCAMCPRDRMNRPQGNMSMTIFENIVREAAAKGCWYLALFMHGEPLLHPHIVEMVHFAKQHGIPKVNVTTNGLLLDEDRMLALSTADLDVLVFSLDGMTAAEHDKLRNSNSYERVQRNILAACDLREGHKPFIQIVSLTCGATTEEIAVFKSFWSQHVDRVTVLPVMSYGTGNALNESDASLPRIPCRHLWQQLTVLWQGPVVPCCVDIAGEVVVGDARHQTLQEIWTGDDMNALRGAHLFGQLDGVVGCAHCTDERYCRARR